MYLPCPCVCRCSLANSNKKLLPLELLCIVYQILLLSKTYWHEHIIKLVYDLLQAAADVNKE